MYLAAETVRTIAESQCELIASKQRGSPSLQVLDWIDDSLNYLNIFKLLSDKHFFDGGKQRELLVEIYCYNYLILYMAIPPLGPCDEDLQMLYNLQAMAEQFVNVSQYQHDLSLSVTECKQLIQKQKKKHADPAQEIPLNPSGPSDYYPSGDDTESADGVVTMREIKTLPLPQTILFDLRPISDFIRKPVPAMYERMVVNIEPEVIESSDSFSQVIDSMKSGNLDYFRRLIALKTYQYVVYYSMRPTDGQTERRLNSLLKEYLDGQAVNVLWLKGGYIALCGGHGSHSNIPTPSPSPVPVPAPVPTHHRATPPVPPTRSYSSTNIAGELNGTNKTHGSNGTTTTKSPLPTPPPPGSPPVPRTQSLQPTQTPLPPPIPTVYIPLVHLFNYGSTCYINSMLQCLFTAPLFRDFFLNGKYQPLLQAQPGQSLAWGFHQLFSNLMRVNGQYVVKPAAFLRLCASLKPDLRIPSEQQDTSQFLYFIMDQLHTELKIQDTPENRRKFATGDVETDPFALYSPRKEYKKWHDSLTLREGVSPISGLFQIQQETCLKCTRCGFRSFNYDYSSMLHLNLNGYEQRLNDLILKNLNVEEMSDRLDNAWNCPNCAKLAKRLSVLDAKALQESTNGAKKHSHFKFKTSSKDKHAPTDGPATAAMLEKLTPAEKEEYQTLTAVLAKPSLSYRSTAFIKLPKMLVVYLAKFDPFQNKLTNVNLHFPKSLKFRILRDKKEVSYQYRLSSWIDHLGTSISSGHYTSVVSRDRQWFYCDDENINEVDYHGITEIGDSDGYLLFYTIDN